MQVVEQLLGEGPSTNASSREATGSITDADLALDFVFNGLSLRDLAAEEDAGPGDADIHRPQTIEECMCPLAPSFYFLNVDLFMCSR